MILDRKDMTKLEVGNLYICEISNFKYLVKLLRIGDPDNTYIKNHIAVVLRSIEYTEENIGYYEGVKLVINPKDDILKLITKEIYELLYNNSKES